MAEYVALLRAVNVGGTGKLAMADLRAMAERVGFARARTYIASGNLVFEADATEAEVKSRLEAALAEYAGRPVGVLVRTGAELADVLTGNPFADAPGNRVAVIFLDAPPPPDALDRVRGRRDEAIHLGHREIYVHYPSGMGDSRLVIPDATAGTARNLNTVAKLAAMAAELQGSSAA